MVELKLEGITKTFNSPPVTAVEPTDLTIEHGEFFTLVGPSGCGKTTLLRMIAGLESPTGGELYFDGERITDLTPQQRDIAMVFQNIALYPHMTCYENMGYGLKVRGDMENAEEKIREAAELLDITDQLDKKPGQLSGGQQQRVALGRAIVREPNLILLDEPMSDLDAKLKAELRVVFQELHNEIDTTLIYVTHDQEEAMTMSTRVGLMRDGSFVQVDEPNVLFDSPTNDFAASFIGQPSMNLLDVSIDEQGMVALENDNGINRCIDLSDYCDELPSETLTDGEVRIGFRPPHVKLTTDSADSLMRLRFKLYEQNGDNMNIYTESFDGENIVIVSSEEPTYEQDTEIGIDDISKLYLFDAVSGEKIIELTSSQFEKKIYSETPPS